MGHLQETLYVCRVRGTIEMNDLEPHKKERLYPQATGKHYHHRISLFLIEFTYRTLSACKSYTISSITRQLFEIKNVFSPGKNIINGNYLSRQEHKRLLTV